MHSPLSATLDKQNDGVYAHYMYHAFRRAQGLARVKSTLEGDHDLSNTNKDDHVNFDNCYAAPYVHKKTLAVPECSQTMNNDENNKISREVLFQRKFTCTNDFIYYNKINSNTKDVALLSNQICDNDHRDTSELVVSSMNASRVAIPFLEKGNNVFDNTGMTSVKKRDYADKYHKRPPSSYLEFLLPGNSQNNSSFCSKENKILYEPHSTKITNRKFGKGINNSKNMNLKDICPSEKQRYIGGSRPIPLDHLFEALSLSESDKEMTRDYSFRQQLYAEQAETHLAEKERHHHLESIHQLLSSTGIKIRTGGDVISSMSASDGVILGVKDYMKQIATYEQRMGDLEDEKWVKRRALLFQRFHVKDASREATDSAFYAPLIKRLLGTGIDQIIRNAINELPEADFDELWRKHFQLQRTLTAKPLSLSIEETERMANSYLYGENSQELQIIQDHLTCRTISRSVQMYLNNVNIRVLDLSKGYLGTGKLMSLALVQLVKICINVHTLNLEGIGLHHDGMIFLCSQRVLGSHPSMLRVNLRGNVVEAQCLRSLCFAARGGIDSEELVSRGKDKEGQYATSEGDPGDGIQSLKRLIQTKGVSENRHRIVEIALDLTNAEKDIMQEQEPFVTFLVWEEENERPAVPIKREENKLDKIAKKHHIITSSAAPFKLMDSTKKRLQLCLRYSLMKSVIAKVPESFMKRHWSEELYEALEPLYRAMMFSGYTINQHESEEHIKWLHRYLDKRKALYDCSDLWADVLFKNFVDMKCIHKHEIDNLTINDGLCYKIFVCVLENFTDNKLETDLRFAYLRYVLPSKKNRYVPLLSSDCAPQVPKEAVQHILLPMLY